MIPTASSCGEWRRKMNPRRTHLEQRCLMRLATLLALLVAASAVAAPVPLEKAKADGTFLVQDSDGLAYLDAKGRETGRPGEGTTNGALSPDGRWLACLPYDRDAKVCKFVILPRDGKGVPVVVPGVSVTPIGEGFLPVWAADGKRLLARVDRVRTGGWYETTYHVYDTRTKKTVALRLPEGHLVSGWSEDGKRLLTQFGAGGEARLCWLDADGKGKPEFLSPADEVAVYPKLSPDGRRILFRAAPRPEAGKRSRLRLYVMDLATKKRVTVGEPGETHGYCWSGDGSAVAFTWQRTPVKGDEEAERTTLLITCDAEGRNAKTIASRKKLLANPGLQVTIFFQVIDWR